MSAEFVANMEDVLDLYAEPYDPQRPVVCFDETSTQLLAETRPALPPRPGLPLRQDYAYRIRGDVSWRIEMPTSLWLGYDPQIRRFRQRYNRSSDTTDSVASSSRSPDRSGSPRMEESPSSRARRAGQSAI